MINIFVGNVDFNATEEELRGLFSAHGAVETVTIVKDRDTGSARGFAFVEMVEDAAGKAAISALNGTLLHERSLRVNEARPKLPRDEMRSPSNRDHRHHQI